MMTCNILSLSFNAAPLMGSQRLIIMSDAKYLKGSCQHCDNHIEFPAEAAGSVVDCPHCGNHVRLVAPAAPAAPEVISTNPAPANDAPRKTARPTALLAIIGALTLIAIIGAGWF